MFAHVNELYNQIVATTGSADVRAMERDWERVESNVSRQLPLRVLSCVQIATKLNSTKEVLFPSAIQACLRNLGVAYTEDAIRRSEVRVLEAVQWCVQALQSPIVYLESVLALLVRDLGEHGGEIESDELWELSNSMLDLVYLRMDAVYDQIVLEVFGNPNAVLGERVTRLKADYFLIVAGVVAASCVSLQGLEFADEAVRILSNITHISSQDVQKVASGVMKVVMSCGALDDVSLQC